MRVLILLAAMGAILEVARRWDAHHPLRSSRAGRPAVATGRSEAYLDWALLETSMARLRPPPGPDRPRQPGQAAARSGKA